MKITMLKLPSIPHSVVELEAFIQQMAGKYKIDNEKYPNILISLTEAVNNAIIHGNNQDASKFVDIRLHKTNKGISISVSDEGDGFNPKNIPDPTLEENLECCGGRGVFLIQQLSDDVSYKDNGRTVEMHFRL